ncbi:hypothetical protein [Azospirillum sp. sgz302134]
MLSSEAIEAMVNNALKAGGYTPKPVPATHRAFQRGNGGPAEKHGMSLFGYFEAKKPAAQRRTVLVSA